MAALPNAAAASRCRRRTSSSAARRPAERNVISGNVDTASVRSPTSSRRRAAGRPRGSSAERPDGPGQLHRHQGRRPARASNNNGGGSANGPARPSAAATAPPGGACTGCLQSDCGQLRHRVLLATALTTPRRARSSGTLLLVGHQLLRLKATTSASNVNGNAPCGRRHGKYQQVRVS